MLYLRRYKSDRRIQRETGVHRKTVKRYREWALQQALMSGPLPTLGELEKLVEQSLPEKAPPQNRSSLEPYIDIIYHFDSILVRLRFLFDPADARTAYTSASGRLSFEYPF
jgi:hypothetical protein